jgi:ACS family glucarate transporter-like MFS transporter
MAHKKIRVRWWIFVLMSSFAMMSYIQRQSVAVAADHIMPALHLTQMQIAWLNASFTAAYAIAQLPGGLLGQRLGGRWTYVLVGVVGLLATLATPVLPMLLAGGTLFIGLLVSQATLGLSQGPVFPVFAVVAEKWFPPRRWALVNGAVSSFMNLGGAITPVFIVVLTEHFGWQGALLWVGVPVFLLTVFWAWYGRDTPREHPSVTADERAEVIEDGGQPPPMTLRRLAGIIGNRDIALLTASYCAMNYAFYLISFWSFLYLVQVRHFSGLESGLVGALPWVGAGIGAGIGGGLADWLAERFGARWGYRLVPMLSLPTAGLLLLLTTHVATPYAAVAALSLAFLAVELNEGPYWAAAMRVARVDTGAATGVLNTGANLGGLVSQPIVGLLSGAGLWSGAFFSGAVFAILAGVAWLWIDADRQKTLA